MQHESIIQLCLLSLLFSDPPGMKLLILGDSLTGKSTLGNVLLGDYAEFCKNCTFKSCHNLNACTKETSYFNGKWLGGNEDVTICDTPGLDTMIIDTSEEENMKTLTDNFMDVLQNDIKYVNGIVLLVKGDQGVVKISKGMKFILRLMEATFGDLIWRNMVLVVSHWSFKDNDVEYRSNSGIINFEYIDEWNDELQKEFSLNNNLKAFFIDSFSQLPYKLDRPDNYKKELNAFQEESSKLWNFVKMNEVFNFLTVHDAYEEVNELKRQKRQLKEVMDEEINGLKKEFEKFKINTDASIKQQVEECKNDITEDITLEFLITVRSE